MNRVDKHEVPRARIAARLRRMGLAVRSAPAGLGYDLVVNDELRVTLRVAFPSMRRHRVTVGGRNYQYRYRTWHFNFHQHGRLNQQYTDFFVCVAVDSRKAERPELFVIPWEKVTGKTFSLHGGRTEYSGRYAPCRDDWGKIATAARRTTPLRRVA